MPEKTYKVPEIISIHALREEGDQRTRSIQTVRKEISIHALREEGDCGQKRNNRRNPNFYPRPPRGGRLCRLVTLRPRKMISIHALREEGDRSMFSFYYPLF